MNWQKYRTVTLEDIEKYWDLATIAKEIKRAIAKVDSGHYTAKDKRYVIKLVRILMKKIEELSKYVNIERSAAIDDLIAIKNMLKSSPRFSYTGIAKEIDDFIVELLV